MNVMKREILSLVGAIIVIGVLFYALKEGIILMSDVSSALAYILVAGIVGILLWGFKPRIERALRKRPKAEPKAEELARAIAEESQKLKEKEEAIKKHTEMIYHQIVRLLGVSSHFEVQQGMFI
jgi:membrane protein implicated in regulation of membrane protease activity